MALRQPKTLESLASMKIADWVATLLTKITPSSKLSKTESVLSRQIETIRYHYESNIPGIFHNKLASETIQALEKLWNETVLLAITENAKDIRRNIIRIMVETVLTKKVTSLSLSSESLFIFQDSLRCNFHLLSGITDLKLNLLKEKDIIRLLKKLNNLRYLSINICTKDILKCIAQNCKLLEELHSGNSKSINDKHVNILIRLRNLRSIDLYNTTVSEKGIATILLSCKNIENIGADADNKISRAIELVASSKKNVDTKFKLKFYQNSRKTTLEQLQLIVKMCPFVEKMTLYKYETSQSNLISTLKDCKHLRELALIDYNFNSDSVNDILRAIGLKLITLNFRLIHEINLNALKCIIQLCPNLQFFYIKNCFFVNETKNAFSSDFHENVEIIPSLKMLKTVTFDAWSKTKSKINEQLLTFLLTNCPNIEIISTGSSIYLTDDIMFQILDRNPMIYLKELRMEEGELTELVIDRIIRNCINFPEVDSPPEILTCYYYA